jgi:hypothetical protein
MPQKAKKTKTLANMANRLQKYAIKFRGGRNRPQVGRFQVKEDAACSLLTERIVVFHTRAKCTYVRDWLAKHPSRCATAKPLAPPDAYCPGPSCKPNTDFIVAFSPIFRQIPPKIPPSEIPWKSNRFFPK